MQTKVQTQGNRLAQAIESDILQATFGYASPAFQQLRSTGLFTGDVESDCMDFQQQIRGEHRKVPVVYGLQDLNRNVPTPIDDLSMLMIQQKLVQLPQHWQITSVPPKEALSAFARNLASFFDLRFAGGPPPGGTTLNAHRPMLAFKVGTIHQGGRVHVAPCYRLNFNRVFGSPTSPVNGALDPGWYIFGVEYSYGSFQWDKGTYHVPPDTEAQLKV